MTDQLRQAAQQARQALETLMIERESIYDKAITALNVALAQEHAMHELARLGQEIEQGKRGSIALARSLCYEIAGATSEDDMDGGGYGSVDIAEILSAEVVRLQAALAQPEQQAEPVAWMFQHDETGRMNYVSNDGRHTPDLFLKTNLRYALVCPLYAAPPQRHWVGLTDEDWGWVADRKGTSLDSFEQGATWAAYKLERRNK